MDKNTKILKASNRHRWTDQCRQVQLFKYDRGARRVHHICPGRDHDGCCRKNDGIIALGAGGFLDTAGLDDTSLLGEKRVERTMRALNRSDIVLLVVVANEWERRKKNVSN